MSSETSALLPGGEPKSFYFLAKTKSQAQDDIITDAKESETPSYSIQSPARGWWSSLFRRADHAVQPEGKPRKVPIKVEPKVFFANERTFLAWMHMSVTLASISVAIVAFAEANAWSQVYGLCLLPVAIAFSAYSLWMYIKRSNMIRRKDPGPYEDRAGPIVLSVLLGLAIFVNFAVKLYAYSRR
mmetsp:Transcript_21150/g.46976  ORF Transcript_21150/g.46976 Transcript_21150/m.46976 type:complete len:185 (+) Transcript_21150:157-711(+)